MAVSSTVVAPRAPQPRDGDDAVTALELLAVLCLYRDRAVAAVRARGVRHDDAEDCVHDALLQMMRHPAIDPGRAGSLLTVVAMRRAIDRQRERGRELRALRRIGPLDDAGVPSPDEVAVSRLEAQRLALLLPRLPQRQQDVIRRRAGGCSVAEIALYLGITHKAAESALGRARVALRGAGRAARENAHERRTACVDRHT